MKTQFNWAVLNQPYPRSEVQRQEINLFKGIQCGNVRFNMNRVRTESEQRHFIQQGKERTLPRR